jgi:hypothetical protein
MVIYLLDASVQKKLQEFKNRYTSFALLSYITMPVLAFDAKQIHVINSEYNQTTTHKEN